jgi:hypothetical protein
MAQVQCPEFKPQYYQKNKKTKNKKKNQSVGWASLIQKSKIQNTVSMMSTLKMFQISDFKIKDP